MYLSFFLISLMTLLFDFHRLFLTSCPFLSPLVLSVHPSPPPVEWPQSSFYSSSLAFLKLSWTFILTLTFSVIFLPQFLSWFSFLGFHILYWILFLSISLASLLSGLFIPCCSYQVPLSSNQKGPQWLGLVLTGGVMEILTDYKPAWS